MGDTPNEHGLRAVVDDGRESIWNDSYAVVKAGVGYRWHVARRWNHRLQVHVSNILDEVYTYGSGGTGSAPGICFHVRPDVLGRVLPLLQAARTSCPAQHLTRHRPGACCAVAQDGLDVVQVRCEFDPPGPRGDKIRPVMFEKSLL